MISRPDLLADACQKAGFDACLVTSQADLRWLTGFTGSSGLALCGPDIRLFASDFRYEEQAQAEVDSSFSLKTCKLELHDALVDAVAGKDLRVACDRSVVPVGRFEAISEALAPGLALIAVEGLVGRLREVKDESEINAIAAACALADEAFGNVIGRGIVGRSERDVAWHLEREMRELGAQAISFAPIVAFGAHGALPHASPRDVPIEPDTLVVIDWGAELDGYCSDCTRTVSTGAISDEMTKAFESVLSAQQLAVKSVKAGLTGAQVDAVARDRLGEDGLADVFGHGTGHGVGLEVHEGPRVSKAGTTSLQEGMVVTIEPGVYLEGQFGVRIEDLLVVEADGAQVLTTIQRDLITVG